MYQHENTLRTTDHSYVGGHSFRVNIRAFDTSFRQVSVTKDFQTDYYDAGPNVQFKFSFDKESKYRWHIYFRWQFVLPG